MSFVNVDDARRLARGRLPRPIFDFVDGAAEDGLTEAANRAAFRRLWLEPRYLLDTGPPDLKTTVLGAEVALPVLLAPVGQQCMLTRDGELASGRAGALFALSTTSTRSIEEVAGVASGPLWGQVSPGAPAGRRRSPARSTAPSARRAAPESASTGRSSATGRGTAATAW